MGVRKQYEIKLWGMFLWYLLDLIMWSGLLIGIYILLFSIGINSKRILPANYAEQTIRRNKEAISNSHPLDRKLIPNTCKVGLFNKNHGYIGGEFDQQTVEDAEIFLSQSTNYRSRYIVIERVDEYCVIQYDLSAHFASPILNRIFPKLELTMIISFFILFLALVIFMAFLFAKKLERELGPVVQATQQIKERNLDFELDTSHIQEFNEVLKSIKHMKVALAEALKTEWETEERRKIHIAALAHDIKTPLTIIKGNTELVTEEKISSEIVEYMESIEKSSNQIEHYITLLIEATRDDKNLRMKKERVKVDDFIKELTRQTQELCESYQVQLTNIENIKGEDVFVIDKESLLRAMMNVVLNALEHTKDEKQIILRMIEKNGVLTIEVEDFGDGFTREALKYASDQFFTQNTARRGTHYGLGLYMTKQVIKGHKGGITYENKEIDKGAIVSVNLPID